MRIALTMMLVLAATPVAAQEPSQGRPAEPLIVVSGLGQVKAMPDVATVVLGVETQAATAKAAAAANAERQNAVLSALRQQGLPERDVSTSTFAVRQDRDREGLPVAHYTAQNLVEVRTSDLARIGRIIDSAVSAGANRVERVDFSVSKPEPLEEEALALAVEQARRRAAAIAKAAGGELGPLLELSTERDSFEGVRVRAAASVGYGYRIEPTSITPREQTISVSIVGRWRFVPGR